MKYDVYVGIDPGQSGGIAVIWDNGKMSALKMAATEHDVNSILFDVMNYCAREDKTCFAFIEKVHSMPGQGVSSSFKFGKNYGFLRGCLVANNIPFDEVSPQRWQKDSGIVSKAKTESKTEFKNRLKAKAQQMHPEIKVNLAIADAILIAEYCKTVKYG